MTTLRRVFHQLLVGSGDVEVSRPTWKISATRWCVALVTLIMVYQLYALIVVPLIEPTARAQVAAPALQSLGQVSADPDLAALFASGSWERRQPKVLETDNAKLLFQDYKPSPDGQLDLNPCTVIFYAPVKGGKQRPIILRSPGGAVLKFAGPLNLQRAEFSRLESARLRGKITISSPPSQPGSNDALHIETSNVQITMRQVWTPNDVIFQYGPHYGSGRDLMINLVPAGADDLGSTPPGQFGHLQSLELVHLDKLAVSIPGRGMFPAPAAPHRDTDPPAAKPSAAPAAPIEVTCQGAFQFDFEARRAVFEQQVDIVRSLPHGQIDHLQGDQLTLEFGAPSDAKPTDSQDPGAGKSPPRGSITMGLQLRRIEMTGRPVILDAPSYLVAAEGNKLAYDFTTRRLHLENERRAMFSYRYHYVEAPRLDYEVHAEPSRLGRLWAAGPGEYHGRLGPRDTRQITATWNGDLELQPQDNLHVLSAAQGTRITVDQASQFAADRVFLWLEEVPAETRVARSPTDGPALVGPDTGKPPAAATPKGDEPGRKKYHLRPVKMLATGRVHAASPQFTGDTNRLETWFDVDNATAATAVASGNQNATGSKPNQTGSATPVAMSATKTAERRLDVGGDRVRLRVILAKPTRIREATVTGHVHVEQQSTGPAAGPLSVITGDTLQLRVDRWNRTDVDVTGAPAHISAQGMLMDGTNLHLSQRENRIWADGPGRMKLPARVGQADQQSTTATPVWISWENNLDFDGQLIRFAGNVDVRGVLETGQGDRNHLRAVGAQLHVHLNRFVALDHPGKSDDLDATQLDFLGTIHAENQTFASSGELTSRDQMMFKNLTWDRTTGAFHGDGPGWIVSTRRQRRQPAPPIPARTNSATDFTYVRVDFQSEAVGNFDRRELEFRHFVRTVYGPVATWDDVLDPNRPGGLGAHGFVMTCDRLNMVDMGRGQAAALEMKAAGKITVEGSEYFASGSRLSYTQNKGLLILEGAGHSLAKLEFRQVPGKRPSVTEAQKFMYWPATGQFEAQGIQRGDFFQYSAPQLPSARIR